MKKTIPTEKTVPDYENFFDDRISSAGQIALCDEFAVLANDSPFAARSVLDRFLAAIKWTLLYFPGVVAVHFMLMGSALAFFYGDWFTELFLGMLGILAVAVFMIMFGIGKFMDLRYLRVVAAVFGASFAAALLYEILIHLIPGDYFGIYTQASLAAPVLAGFLVKKMMDRQAASEEKY